MSGQLLNQIQAAAYLGVNVKKVRKWGRDGVLPVFIDPDSLMPLYPVKALDAWQLQFTATPKGKAS